jgi:mRNA interferase MazF
MPSTTNFKKWEVILVPFPFTYLTTNKKRPALIVSNNDYNKSENLVIALITSNIRDSNDDYKIIKWSEAGFPKESVIKMKFATVDKSIIVRKLGKLKKEDIDSYKIKLIAFFEKE